MEPRDPPRGRTALHLIELWQQAGSSGLLFLARTERLAEHLGANIHALVPECPVMVFPRWDCLPYDPAGPSREVMGRRASVLRRLAERIAAPLVITTVEAALQRVPPRDVWQSATLKLERDGQVALSRLRSFLERTGYSVGALVDEPGETALHGQVVDVFPAGALGPARIDYDDGHIAGIYGYDPQSQLTVSELDHIVLDAASEMLPPVAEDGASAPPPDSPWLCDWYSALETLFDYMPRASVVLDTGAEERVALWRERISEEHAASKDMPVISATLGSRAAPPPCRLYMEEPEWRARLAESRAKTLEVDPEEEQRVPVFATAANPTRAYQQFVEERLAAGWRIVLTAAAEGELKTMSRRARSSVGNSIARVRDWRGALACPAATLAALQIDFEAGFLVPAEKTAVIAAADLLGSRAGHEVPMGLAPRLDPGVGDAELRLGDAVVHLEHGIGLLRGIETLSSDDTPAQDVVRLQYAGDTTLLVPIEEIGSIWRYGGAPDAVSLDRLDGQTWHKRRGEVEAEIAQTARALADLAKQRQQQTASVLAPPARDYERFVSGFPFVATADQARAVEDVLDDLRSGHPMDRLVCGDVGFGKTEVALRAAAAAVLSGKQVAIVVPTTVLARQHIETFRRRFAPFGIAIGHLSRLVKPAESRAVKKGLADGTVQIVIGTHAIAGKDIRFNQLALVIIDEEQRFGARLKAKLHAFGHGVHKLTMSATPIPRTLQRAMVGLQSLSILANPPARRLPIRTVVTPFEPSVLREASLHERRRGGQSFVVCPRIEDIEPLRDQLTEIVPELQLKVAHGKLPAQIIDDVMVAFANGRGDVLLTTNIIESGLDLPRANTILIWRPDRFGAAQLHQLRGRVGRGRRRGLAYLLTDPRSQLAPATANRLQMIAELDRLGAGFTISQRDMDLRGAGDILGEKQAGHIRLVGAELYRHLLERAIAGLNGGSAEPEWRPELNLGVTGLIPSDYIADPEIRINLYARAARIRELRDIDRFADEIEDRFGQMPPATQNLLQLARIRETARRLGVVRLDAGPRAIALTLQPDRVEPMRRALGCTKEFYWKEDRLVHERTNYDDEPLRATLTLLDRLGSP